MADVELLELRDGGNGGDIVEGEAVAGMGLDAVLGGERGGVGDAAELLRLRLPFQMGVAAGMELDDGRLQPDRRLDLPRVGLDEQADSDIGFGETSDEGRQVIMLPGRVEAAFGGAFLALFGDYAGGVGAVAERDLQVTPSAPASAAAKAARTGSG